MFPEDLLGFIQDTQPKSWERLKSFHNGASQNTILDRLVKVQDTEGKNRNFAVIADEAHSSQTGSSASQLRKVLGGDQLAIDEDESYEDYLIRETEARSLPSNISFIAFTATPKGKTLELFGRKDENGLPLG